MIKILKEPLCIGFYVSLKSQLTEKLSKRETLDPL